MKDVELDIDLDSQGRTNGWVRLGHSHDLAGYGTVATPIVVLANGPGPTLLLVAGNHGDEYEGQVALSRFMRELDVAEMRGRIIILPAANLPAATAGTRLSPIDNGNLNRSFGIGGRTPTGILASFIETQLLPLASCVIDLHSGGRSMDYLPSVFVQDAQTDDLRARTHRMVTAFGAPWCFVKPHDPVETTMLGASGRAGVPYLSTELSGGERLNRDCVELALGGIRRVMSELGMIDVAPSDRHDQTWLTLPDWNAFSYAEAAGVFELMQPLGAELKKGDLLGVIHVPERPFAEPLPVHVRRDGVLVCIRTIARVKPGDCLGHVGCRS
jgi:predicted deacylase